MAQLKDLRFRVFLNKSMIATFMYAEDAAALLASYGPHEPGVEPVLTIRDGFNRNRLLWTEGEEEQSAAESYDHVATVVFDRIQKGRS